MNESERYTKHLEQMADKLGAENFTLKAFAVLMGIANFGLILMLLIVSR